MYCDLHMHSTASDGTDGPECLPALAKQAGLAALALTDHDTTEGLAACGEAAREAGITFVPGIELSADRGSLKPARLGTLGDQGARGTLHILGLFIQAEHPSLQQLMTEAQQARAQRNPRMLARLRELGVKISDEEVQELAAKHGGRIVGRPHIAQVLVQKNYAKSIQDAFANYIGYGKPAYVRKDHLPPAAAIAAIHAAGGLAILAHPVQLRCEDADELEHTVKRLQEMGLDGMETRHPDHTPADVDRLSRLAEKYELLPSGGSDYHGTRKTVALGSQKVAMEVFERLRAAWDERKTPAARTSS